jgi:hypothetical protein
MPLLLSPFSASRARLSAPRVSAPSTRWETDHVLSAWLSKAAPATASSAPAARDGAWLDPHRPVELVYDTCDQALPTGIRAVVRDGSRRLLYAADELEVLLRVAQTADTGRFEVVGQVLNEGVPTAGVPVRLAGASDAATTDRGGSFHLHDLPAGPCALEIHIGGHILDVAPLELK